MERKQKEGRGCFFYGCLTTVLVFIAVIIGLYLGTRQAARYAVSMFTTNAPAPVPKLELSAAEQESIRRDIEVRAQSATRGTNGTLRLNERELNVLLNQTPELRPYTNQFYLSPSGTQLLAHVSMPLDQFKLWSEFTRKLRSKDLQRRYFNGVAVVRPFVTNGNLSLVIDDLQVNGKSLPGDFTGRLKTFDLAAGMTNHPQAQAILGQINDVSVQDGQVILQLAP